MKIGIDVDGVLLDYEKQLLAKAELFDIEKCRGKGIINGKQYLVQNQYDWTEKEKKQFMIEEFKQISEQSNLMGGAKEVITKLKKKGIKQIIISARGRNEDELITIVTQKFEKENLQFDDYYWKQDNKLDICKKEKIDIMIDDNPQICQKIAQCGIMTYYLKGIRGYSIQESQYLKTVSNWGEIYRHIKEKIK